MTHEQTLTLDRGTLEVECIRYLILTQEGMATKSLIEDILIARYGIDRGEARTFTNEAEFRNLRYVKFNPVRWATIDHPEPTMAQFPEVSDYRARRKYFENKIGQFGLRRKFDQVTLIYLKGSMTTEDATSISNHWWFLVPMNETFSAAQLAEAMTDYSTHEKTKYFADLLKGIAQREETAGQLNNNTT